MSLWKVRKIIKLTFNPLYVTELQKVGKWQREKLRKRKTDGVTLMHPLMHVKCLKYLYQKNMINIPYKLLYH